MNLRARLAAGLLAAAVLLPALAVAAEGDASPTGKPKIYVAFHWHMHQPIYWPYETITQTAQNPDCTDAVVEYLTWPDRVGAYTHYPIDTVRNHAHLPHVGAQISFSGSLIENLNDLAAHGIGYGRDWAATYREGRRWTTSLGNPRVDLVAFGYHHPLMPLCGYEDVRRQIRLHRELQQATFGGPPSKGMFPPENAFALPMIPALVDEGLEWVMVDNIHFDRACRDYPWTPRQIIEPPNPADQRNPAQPHHEALTCQQNTVNMVSTGFAFRPHWAEYVDPATGKAVTPAGRPARMIVVPTERSIGYDDSYGDRDPIDRLKQIEAWNTDPDHPFLIVMAHDGDNAGASGSRYYLETCSWIGRNPDRYEVCTIQDYLAMFPPDPDDVIHVEDGSWTGADLGDQEFKKWNGDPYLNGQIDHEKGYSPDRNSWAVITAARNRVLTAEAVAPGSEAVEKAWHEFLVGTTSCYWYWDGTFEWDLKPTIAANNAMDHADPVLAGLAADTVAPTIYAPQREPYNPGGVSRPKPEAVPSKPWTWRSPWVARYPASREPWRTESSDFMVWTLVYDVSGLESVNLMIRVADGREVGPENLVYEGGTWTALPMEGKVIPDVSSALGKARYKALQYGAGVKGLEEVLVDYYVEAVDGKGNRARSPIRHVWVGRKHVVPELVSPAAPTPSDVITIRAPRGGSLHWGVNGWTLPDPSYWPEGTTPWGDGKAVDTVLAGPDENGSWSVRIGPFDGAQTVESIDFVFHFDDDTWGTDHVLPIRGEERLRSSAESAAWLLKISRAARRLRYAPAEAPGEGRTALRRWNELRAEVLADFYQASPELRVRMVGLLKKFRSRSEAIAEPLDRLLSRLEGSPEDD